MISNTNVNVLPPSPPERGIRANSNGPGNPWWIGDGSSELAPHAVMAVIIYVAIYMPISTRFPPTLTMRSMLASTTVATLTEAPVDRMIPSSLPLTVSACSVVL
jgi:hypothetical protein